MAVQRLTTRSRRTAEAIRDCEPFVTSGNFYGEKVRPGTHHSSGHLNEQERTQLFSETAIDYIVWSYWTPIAWHRTDGTWYRVSQTFSVTTSKHQGNLYLTPSADHKAYVTGKRGDWQVYCATCGKASETHYRYKRDAHRAVHNHRINGR